MRAQRLSLFQCLTRLVFFSALVVLVACETGRKTREWTEDVRVDGASPIVVERRVDFTLSNSLSGDAPNEEVHSSTVTLLLPGGASPAWSGQLIPILVYQDSASQEWVLVATTINCSAWRTGGGPLPPYWEYRLRGGAWITVPLSATSIGRKANLFVMYDEPLPADHLEVAQKEQIEREVNLAPVFRSVEAEQERFRC